MKRRNFIKTTAAALATGCLATNSPGLKAQTPAATGNRPAEITGLTRDIAAFIVDAKYADLPSELIELGRKSILDGLGLALCGSVAESGAIMVRYLEAVGVTRTLASTVIGTSLFAPPSFAALANGVAIHADDFDDTQLAVAKDRVYGLLTHPTVSVLPSGLAVAEKQGAVSGRDWELAYHVGVEVECKICEAINPRSYEEGFHSTGFCGPLGAAATVAKIRGFDVAKTARTLGIAASLSAGLRENFGTMTKPLHAGRAAESGVIAADLADLGWTATDKILEARRGFFQAFGGGFDPTAIVNKLGRPWTFVSPGVSIKPYPSGSLTHPGMSEMLRLIRANKITPEQVVSVDVGTNRNMPNALIHHQPTDSLQAKFSMEFCMAVLLLYGRAGLQEFTDEVVNRPEVKAMIGRVQFGEDSEAEKAGYDKMTTIIKIQLKDGRVVTGRADFGKGSPANPMSYAEVAEKFTGCAAFAKWSEVQTRAIVEMVRVLQDVHDVRELALLCRR
jgi:2-methylcitrate dehydratase PrpD